MPQIYHSNAQTNRNIRIQIQNSTQTNATLAKQFGTSSATISKWKNRDFSEDKSSAPKTIVYALSEVEKELIKKMRTSTWMSLEEVTECIQQVNSTISRSSVYRCFVKEKINTIPTEKKQEAKKFKAYQPGYLHIDVTYLPKLEGKAAYLFVAIDRATRLLFYKIYDQKTAENTELFMDECIEFFPFQISHILTDNGLEFTNRLIRSKKGNLCQKPSKMDEKCKENDIEHRLTKPNTPQTNGMVERVNGTIKQQTILKDKYKSREEMEIQMNQFLVYYNLYRRHGSLRKELNVKTPIQAIYKWFEIEPTIFKQTPKQFETKLINLQQKYNQNS
ncbi:integrase family protein [Bernardetia litoralis DSM 6794]|uniref:Integrase family protein n=1 Tax=Bernardetia litoralis (strain ATCC 23117 / DSM 6794 / NBRC 15988 / NCIMB 1366 / Fx l1 / Sio-4) TaxID=880071 RepID=I4AEY2_BERLS|nr:DDE-type integrase/transposase/recombinase [Bernardetia litoralis]AFM02517.1 integrase family protein [Bernardetia litoralis DSM 6794]AFM02810.1 integrase family protein [Bernardetia litoralis DSM 6794]AFM03084.1 integrase family protein [Bernardetia litoralis DSM 6794]AFM05369.1 integrase family protein [Bernardetia litoralis DSM 6794]AFM06114.1 integrase family protein [Bernardetia litoralis DSM 6794]